MSGPPLSPETEKRVTLLFPIAEQETVREILLEDVGSNLPFCKNTNSEQMDRCRFAVLKLSKGNLLALRRAVDLAKKDWRDLFMAAGFGEPHAHKSWLP